MEVYSPLSPPPAPLPSNPLQLPPEKITQKALKMDYQTLTKLKLCNRLLAMFIAPNTRRTATASRAFE